MVNAALGYFRGHEGNPWIHSSEAHAESIRRRVVATYPQITGQFGARQYGRLLRLLSLFKPSPRQSIDPKAEAMPKIHVMKRIDSATVARGDAGGPRLTIRFQPFPDACLKLDLARIAILVRKYRPSDYQINRQSRQPPNRIFPCWVRNFCSA